MVVIAAAHAARGSKQRYSNPIDAFVLVRLEAHCVERLGRADRRTPIRRLTFGLLDVRPSPEDVKAFV